MTSGNSVTVYAITRDQYGNFVANAAGTWSLINKTGGVASGDVVPAGDNKSALFTGHLVGTGTIHIAITGLASFDSGTITVVPYGSSNPTVVATIPLLGVVGGENSDGVAVNPSTGLIYVTNGGTNNVSVINDATNNVVTTVNVGSSPYGVAANSITNLI